MVKLNRIIQKIKKNGYLYFTYKSLVFLIILLSLDYLIGKTLEYLYFQQESGLQYRTTYSMEKTASEILIFGSSRANRHYNPEIFENRLKQSTYNTGRDASSILFHFAILQTVLKRYKPKTIILDLSGGEFKKSNDAYDRLSALLPYYKRHQEIQPIILLRSKYEKIKLLSKIYPYNSSLFTILIGNTAYNKKRSPDKQGYMPLQKAWNDLNRIDIRSSAYEIDSVKIKIYENFIQNCLHSNIQLFIVSSPYLLPKDSIDYSIAIGKIISEKHGVRFFDFSNDTTFTHKEDIFADLDHLNWLGADIFSNRVIDSISTELKPYQDNLTPSKSP